MGITSHNLSLRNHSTILPEDDNVNVSEKQVFDPDGGGGTRNLSALTAATPAAGVAFSDELVIVVDTPARQMRRWARGKR